MIPDRGTTPSQMHAYEEEKTYLAIPASPAKESGELNTEWKLSVSTLKALYAVVPRLETSALNDQGIDV